MFAGLRERAGTDRRELELADGATVADVWPSLGLGAEPAGLLYAVNRTYAEREQPLEDGDEVALIPPVSGGAFRLIQGPVNLTSVVVVRADSAIKSAHDLAGKKLGVGAADSPQATLIPLASLAELGVEGHVVRHDVLNGKHGDHIGGERDAIKALLAGTVDAACIIDGNRLAFAREGLIGTVGPTAVRVVHQTATYDHCNFTVLDDPHPETEKFTSLLLGMSYDDPTLRPLLDMEGLKKWLPGRVSGYSLLDKAVDRYRYLDHWLARVAA